jgi:large subunit ribosomal protein L43
LPLPYREWLRSNLISFATNNPNAQITTEIKRNCHPVLRGTYLNGNNKTICVKNLEPARVNDFALFLRNQVGYKLNGKYKKPVMYSEKKSIQGEWHERLDLIPLKMSVDLYYPNETK